MRPRTQIHFDLVSNARDSIRQAVQLLAWEELERTSDEHSRLKRAIMFSHHSIELLLKEKLRQVNPALVWEKVDEYPSLSARTVTSDRAISRLKSICGVAFSAADESNLHSLRLTRNRIEHYEWEMEEKHAKVIVGTALSFAFSFAIEHLNVDLAKEFKEGGTWKQLLDELWEFGQAHTQRLEVQLRNKGMFTLECDECGASAVTEGGTCEVCGHWQDTMKD
jgi:hypothetical protein